LIGAFFLAAQQWDCGACVNLSMLANAQFLARLFLNLRRGSISAHFGVGSPTCPAALNNDRPGKNPTVWTQSSPHPAANAPEAAGFSKIGVTGF